jgi:vitamin B12 transporter
MRKHYLLIFSFFISTSFLQAQDSLKTTILNEVVTTASRYEQHVIETPRSVTVITSSMMEKSLYNSVGELLSNQSGIYVVGANQTPGSTQSLFMRGASSNQVAVMIDGARITDPSSPNSSIDLNELSLTDVERIEIIRGAHSTLYGGGAVGGVVNIITKRKGQPGLHGNADVQAGVIGKSASTLSENARLNYTFKNGLYLTGSLFNQNVNGLNASLDTLNNAELPSDKDDFTKTDSYIKVGFKNDAFDVFLSYKNTDQSADIDDGVYNDDDNAYLDFDRNLVEYHAGYQLTKNWRVIALGSRSDSERLSVNDSSVTDLDDTYDHTYVRGKYTGKIQTNEIQVNYQTQKAKGVFGVGQFREDMNFNTYYFNRSSFGVFESRVNYDTLDTSAKVNYLFAQVNLNINDFNIAFGSRWSNHSLFGDHWTFDVNPSFYFNSMLLYASVSTGFNPASLYQLYDPSKGFNAYATRGNPNLKPETSTSIELGVKKEFPSGIYVTLSAYRTQTRNAIEYIYLWNKDTPIPELTFEDNRGDVYLNIAEQIVNGVEVEGRVLLGKFELRGNVTWLDGSITMDLADMDVRQTGGHHVQLFNYGTFVRNEVEIDKLVRRPNLTTYLALSFTPIQNISVSAVHRYAGSRFDSGYDENLGPYGALNQFNVESYHLVDIGASWEIRKSLTLGIKVENIFDQKYQEIIGFQTRGRSAYLKVGFRW